MPLTPLTTALDMAEAKNTFAIGFVCLGWEDAQAYVAAGEAAGAPVILSAGPGARAHMPVNIWAEMFQTLAEKASIPVIAHLDHGRSLEECEAAIKVGFSSVMFDGSALPLEDNIRMSQAVVDLAKGRGASVETELGVVGYADGAASAATSIDDVRTFLEQVETDALAVSVGNVHLVTDGHVVIDWDAAKDVSKSANVPLVIHGGSGVAWDDRLRLAQTCGVRKINLGTEFRQRYGESLRRTLAEDRDMFDRLKISQGPKASLIELAIDAFKRARW